MPDTIDWDSILPLAVAFAYLYEEYESRLDRLDEAHPHTVEAKNAVYEASAVLSRLTGIPMEEVPASCNYARQNADARARRGCHSVYRRIQ